MPTPLARALRALAVFLGILIALIVVIGVIANAALGLGMGLIELAILAAVAGALTWVFLRRPAADSDAQR